MYVILKGRIILKKEKLKHIAKRITALAAAAAMAATFTFPTGTELLGINFGMSVVASAETMTDGNFDYTVNENTVTITKYNGSGGEVEIPATIGGNTVTSIGAEAFSGCSSLTSVAIPDGVSSIGVEAFFGCSSLRSITIPDSVTSIGEYAFHSCTSLESINIPDSVTKIDRYTFTNCTSLSVITIPKNVTSIASSAFMACSGLSSINVAEENTKYISDDGVLFDKNKTELLFYPANKNGTSYAIPDGVTTIESNAFYENNNLVSITIPDSVTYIGAGAFDSCKKLTSVSIPASVNYIGIEAFNSCESLTAISVHENNSEYSSEDGVLFDKNKTILVVYPAEKSEKSYTVPNTVKHILMNSFTGCVNLENITLNEGVENIDLAAFMGCTNLKSINIPSSVTAIGDRAFMSCTSLTEISVHADNSNYSSVDNVLFDKNKTTLIVYPGGKSDTSYSVPSSVTSVYNMAFRMCPNLESIAFPPNVTSFGYSVIIGCEKLASVFVPESAAFNNQIDPAKMFTSEVRYAVSDDKANITGIELGTGQTTVDIPETICGYTVASVLQSQWAKVGKHTHKWDENDNCALCGNVQLTNVSITISEPKSAENLAATASVTTTGVAADPTISWQPADTTAAYNTTYTASVTLTASTGYAFSDSVSVSLNGTAVDSSNISYNADGTITVKYTFAAKNKRKLTSSDFTFAAPSVLVYNGSAKTASVTTALDGVGDITIKYYDENGAKLSSAPVNAGTYTVKIDVAEGDDYQAISDLTADSWKFSILFGCAHTSLTKVPAKSATCTTDGNSEYWYCDTCGKYFSDAAGTTELSDIPVIQKKGHNWSSAWETDENYHWHKCLNAGCTIKSGKARHYSNAAATEDSPEVCRDCGYEMNPALGHTHNLATEYSSDETGHWYACSDCDEKVDFEKHTEDSGTVTADGKVFRCIKCGWVIRTEAVQEIAKPVITKCFAGVNMVGLNWTSVEGAESYRVYYWADGKWTYAGSRTANGMYVKNLTAGKKYGFAVKAVAGGKVSKVVSADIRYATPMAALTETVKPAITKAFAAGNGTVGLNWTLIEGAESYRVYYWADGKWTYAGSRTVNGMYVRNLTAGKSYGFAVKAYVKGKYTDVVSKDIVYVTVK